MTDLESLARRVEAEEPSGALWEQALVAIYGERSPQRYRFHDFVQCQAWRDAAALMVPHGWRMLSGIHSRTGAFSALLMFKDDKRTAKGESNDQDAEARARLAAALRAHAASAARSSHEGE